jgi:hypothetical protein
VGSALVFLVGAIVIAILMHLHFKKAPDVRVALVSPEVFVVIGCLVGISLGMRYFPDGRGRVLLDHGVIHALAGVVAGGFIGIGVRELFERWTRARIVAVVLTLVLLGGSIGAPIGWLYGSGLVPDPDKLNQLTPGRGMLWGSAIGCIVGLAVGLYESCLCRRPQRDDTSEPRTGNAVS